MSIDLTAKKLTHTLEVSVDFPCGTPEQIYEELLRIKELFIKEDLHKHQIMQSGNFKLVTVTFMDEWGGYEDHEYYLVATLEETDEAYHMRQEKAIRIRLKQAEADKAKQEAAKNRAIQKKQDEIKELESRLAKLMEGL
jgi:hypothetical protein